jgi:threonylcarbamoyladenosine tRNA methylthiotransferase MtaB
MNVEVISLGCRLNLAESESLRGLLAGEGDLIVINSCAVTTEALRQTRQAIRRARRARPEARLLVTGCAAEIDRPAIAAMPEVDGLIANGAKLDPRAWNVATLPTSAPAKSQHTRAFIAAQTGCDHACTFCVIPQGRGPSLSRPIARIVDDITRQSDSGVHEIILTGVDLTAWGLDLPDTPRLGTLVTAILRACPTLPRLRLSSLDGVEIDDELLDLVASEPRVMPHLHLSLQHGDDLILKRMKRRHLRHHALDLVAALRARRSDLAIGADLIAGFPTEDEAAHHANLSIIAELGIVHGHVFPYSARASTPAARMPQTPLPLIRARAAELRAAVAAEHARWQHSLIGTPLAVLAERDGTGHADNFARVRLPVGAVPGTLMSITPTCISEGLLA